jgi:hypothetical protein
MHHRFGQLLNESAAPVEMSAVLYSWFVACPFLLLSSSVGPFSAWQQMIYQIALQQAQQQPRTPLPNYELASAWN